MAGLSSILSATTFAVQGVSSFVGARSQSQAIESKSEFDASQQETNSRLAEIRAKDAISRGKKESQQQKLKTKQLIGKQRARLAAQGIEIDSGSALDVQLETAELGAVDAMTIENNAFREATGHRIEAIEQKGQAGMTRLSGKEKSRDTLLTGGLQAASGFARAGGVFI